MHPIITELFKIADSRNISRGEIARRTGRKTPNIIRLATGRQDPTLSKFIEICEAVGVELKLVDKSNTDSDDNN